MKSKSTTISATVKTVPHPDPQRLIDMWAKLVVKELLLMEERGELKNLT
jgi:hypothetical protein